MVCLSRTLSAVVVSIACLGVGVSGAPGQAPQEPKSLEIPKNATALEGVPTVRIDQTAEGASRRVLGKAEAAENRLRVKVKDGKLYWASRDDRPLQVFESGAFTYLSAEPGQYIRITQVNDTISYAEHVDSTDAGSATKFRGVTWWGELRIVVGK